MCSSAVEISRSLSDPKVVASNREHRYSSHHRSSAFSKSGHDSVRCLLQSTQLAIPPRSRKSSDYAGISYQIGGMNL